MASAMEDPEFFKTIGRHFVALTCRQRLPNTTGIGSYFAASGFVISIQNEWFLITAGHIFQKIEEAKRHGVQFVNWQLDDTFALDRKRSIHVDGPGAPETIPFDLDSQVLKVHYCEEDRGNDYAFIYLDSYYVSLLQANGVTAFEEKHWVINKNERAADRVVIIGLPEDQTEELNHLGLVRKTLVSVPLFRVHNDLEGAENLGNEYHASVPDISASGLKGFESMKGMSGGPVIGFWTQPDGDDKMLVLGIQNRWVHTTDTIICHPVAQVVDHIKATVQALYTEYEKIESRTSDSL